MQEEHPFRKIHFSKSGENSFFHKDTGLDIDIYYHAYELCFDFEFNNL